MSHFALTIIGRDRPGIVARVTEVLYRLGCNIADSSCTILGGQFAMILLLSHPEMTEISCFGEAFAPLEENGLSVFLRKLQPGGETAAHIEGQICLISVYGSDKPGIVYPVVRELGERQINITDLNTKLVGPPEQPIYVMMIEAVLPPGLEVEELSALLNKLKAELQVDISIRDITPVEL
jgi:glycine cleavage system transcriptional repressor